MTSWLGAKPENDVFETHRNTTTAATIIMKTTTTVIATTATSNTATTPITDSMLLENKATELECAHVIYFYCFLVFAKKFRQWRLSLDTIIFEGAKSTEFWRTDWFESWIIPRCASRVVELPAGMDEERGNSDAIMLFKEAISFMTKVRKPIFF